jgi:hypothetical protein
MYTHYIHATHTYSTYTQYTYTAHAYITHTRYTHTVHACIAYLGLGFPIGELVGFDVDLSPPP